MNLKTTTIGIIYILSHYHRLLAIIQIQLDIFIIYVLRFTRQFELTEPSINYDLFNF